MFCGLPLEFLPVRFDNFRLGGVLGALRRDIKPGFLRFASFWLGIDELIPVRPGERGVRMSAPSIDVVGIRRRICLTPGRRATQGKQDESKRAKWICFQCFHSETHSPAQVNLTHNPDVRYSSASAGVRARFSCGKIASALCLRRYRTLPAHRTVWSGRRSSRLVETSVMQMGSKHLYCFF